MERITLGRLEHPVRGFLHGSAALASLAGLGVLLAANPGRLSIALSVGVYLGSLVVMFTVSTLYHSIPWGERWKMRMRRLDHAAIYLVVAGTFTPVAIVALEGAWRAGALTAVWAAAAMGIALKLAERRVQLGWSAALQSLMGWGALIPLWQVAHRLGLDTVALLGLGGVVYTAGMVVMVTKRPRLLPPLFSAHELFHLMVVVASAIHVYAIVGRVLPRAF